MFPDDQVILYHNPRCSKSRATLELLRQQGIEPHIVEYLKTPPSREELTEILRRLKLSARDLIRKHETEYAEAGLGDPGLTEETLIISMVQRPKLMERPILVTRGKAAIGRPPDAVLEIL